MTDFTSYSDKELNDLIREIGSEQIRRAQVRRAAERAQLRLPVAV